MKITEFGKIVRKARLDTEITLLQMANELNVSSAFLSGMETGRKKITKEWVEKIRFYFSAHGFDLPKLNEAADVSNQMINLEGLSPAHKMLMAGFARTSLNQADIENLQKLLQAVNARKVDQ